jgi:hypothetical protein
MKKKYFNSIIPKIWIILVLFGVFSSGCNKDFFDKQPLDQVSDGTFWKTEGDAQLALVGCYRTKVGSEAENFWSCRSLVCLDLAAGNGSDKDHEPDVLTDGTLNSSYWMVQNYWQNAYMRIATCNNFLDHVGSISMDDAKKAIIIAEVRTLRAYEYFNLALYFGDVPLVQHVIKISEANSVTRAPKADVWTFVETELKASYTVLPKTRPDAENGRITAGAALAILGRVQMAEKKWSDAVNTYKTIIDNNTYSIDPKFRELFWQVGELSKEIILSSQYQIDVYSSGVFMNIYPEKWGGWLAFSPVNELVKEFECTDGKTIDMSPLYDKNNPYNNRDPRLDYTIMISDRTTFQGQTFTALGSPTSPDRFTKNNWPGYAIHKFMDENFSGALNNSGDNNSIIRYAEVLLSYLESKLESGATIDQTLLDQTINKVRGRDAVKMPPVTTTDPVELRKIVRRERRVEFAFEGLRYYDILRWDIAADELNRQFTGLKLTNDPANYKDYPVDNEGYFIFQRRNFKKGTNELWPIPQTERDINKNLTQNPGY